jgi:hypothetical protein
MPRPKDVLDTSTYSARVAQTLAELRERHCGSVEELQRHLAEHGHEVSKATLYAYERGRANGGSDVPLDLLPALAAAFNFKTATGWLPSQ